MKKSMRKGFTLVELLIVIVVIGILSAMMMLSSTEAVSSARAADIISDLRNLKTAALAWYADNLDYVEGRVDANGNVITTSDSSNESKFSNLNSESSKIQKYMGNEGNISNYFFAGTSSTGPWYVYTSVKDAKVFEKLQSRAKTVGLYIIDENSLSTSELSSKEDVQNSNYNPAKVGMQIR